MKRLFLVLLFSGTALSAQEIKPRFAIMDDYVRQILIEDWDLHAKDSIPLERGYCLQYQLDFWAQEIAYRVTQITAATPTDVGSSYIAFKCPAGPNRAELHVHPATSCLGEDGPCFRGGPYAYQCLESDADTRWLNHSGELFSMIQCSREAVITFWPKALPQPQFRIWRQAPPAPLPNMRSGSIVKDRRTPPFPTGAIRYRQIS